MKALVIALAILAPSLSLANPGKPQLDLEQGRNAYERGDYRSAVETIHPLLYPHIELASEDSVVEAHRLLALSYLFMKKENEAKDEISSLLELRPRYELDPVIDPPVAVRFFERVKRDQEEKLREIRERQRVEEERLRKEAEKRRLAERMVIAERQVIKNSRLVAALPFGVGQWQNRESKKAIFFCVGESVMGTLSLAAWIAINRKYPLGNFPPAEQDTATALTALQLASGGVFWAMVAWGIIDAEVKFKPEIVIETRELPVAPPARPPVKMSLSPIFTPGFYGLGLMGAF
ncbi:MAG TPA: hypothetical protein VFF06_09685 [Polyangia bacterium]|nr:hypothetical protein [Polyangia bacterium]